MGSNINRGQVALKERNLHQSKEAQRRYEAQPNLCKECGGPILLREGERLSVTKKKRFCSQSCSATHNNRGTRRGPQPGYSLERPRKVFTCLECGSGIKKYGKKYCSQQCSRAEASRQVLTRTKGEIFSTSRTWQAARSHIQDHARKVFSTHNPKPRCKVCGYEKHVQVCHVKAVSDFPGEATLREINAISNLMGLCPNHHWEFDH